jgi:hypothetical protein
MAVVISSRPNAALGLVFEASACNTQVTIFTTTASSISLGQIKPVRAFGSSKIVRSSRSLHLALQK